MATPDTLLTVILGTGGTIAGRADSAAEALRYASAQVGVQALLEAVPPLAGLPLEAEQVAQIDSKDMGPAVWTLLARRVHAHLARPEVGGVVVTHGTDTLEETAVFLQGLLAPAKPVVLTAAMRPASSLQADGPQNLLDAVTVARTPGARGVVAVVAGTVFHPLALRKVHSFRLDAFAAGDGGPLGHLVGGVLRRHREWPSGVARGLGVLPAPGQPWPRVEIVTNHAGADGRIVDALLAQGLDGLVLAGTGQGTLSAPLMAAVERARSLGVAVAVGSRCAAGPVPDAVSGAVAEEDLSAAQWRVQLVLELLSRR